MQGGYGSCAQRFVQQALAGDRLQPPLVPRSGAAGSRSEGRAEAVSGRLQALVERSAARSFRTLPAFKALLKILATPLEGRYLLSISLSQPNTDRRYRHDSTAPT